MFFPSAGNEYGDSSKSFQWGVYWETPFVGTDGLIIIHNQSVDLQKTNHVSFQVFFGLHLIIPSILMSWDDTLVSMKIPPPHCATVQLEAATS